jgi:hypothetical protein
MLDFIESNLDAFYILWFLIAGYVTIGFYVGGRRASARFHDLQNQTIKFREKYASGHSNKSLATKLSGANRVLDVIVTTQELWIKGIWPMFTFIGSKYDMTHRVPLSGVKNVRAEGKSVFFEITNESGSESPIELRLRDPNEFVRSIDA